MLHIQSNSFLRRQLFSFSGLYERRWRFNAVIARGVSYSPPCLSRHDALAPSLRSGTISTEIVENMANNAVVKENSWDSSLSRSYESVMEALSSLITGRKRGDTSATGGRYTKLERMTMYLKILDLEEKLAGLNIIHVAGTKGKGSTCAFSEAILRECGFRTGLFTSPHLIDVRERFRVNGVDIAEEKFLQYFWDCWDQLKEKVTKDLPMPPLFQFLTLLAFKIFINERVDVGIFEVGIGGEKDSTNVIKEPLVCGISSLGMDHMDILGDTLGKIASHKAGILKPNVPAFTVPQLPEAMGVIKGRAQQLKIPLDVVQPLSCRELHGLQLSLAGDHQFVNASLAVSLCKSWLQRTGNLEKLFSNDVREVDLPDAFLRGLSSAHLPGRAQIVHDVISKSSETTGDLIYYLDGAHSPESMDACARWFSKTVYGHQKSASFSSLKSLSEDRIGKKYSKNDFTDCGKGNNDKITKQILLFNCMEVRNPQILLPNLVRTCASSGVHFSGALFVPSISSYNKVVSGSSFSSLNKPSPNLSWQYNLQRIWENTINEKDFDLDENGLMNSIKNESNDVSPPLKFLHGDSPLSSAAVPSLSLAIKWLRECAKENPSIRLQVLVTGSLHLVGDVLKLLRR
ncbi:Folylpolyglutamate synthase [Bienertia sinuspersici]